MQVRCLLALALATAAICYCFTGAIAGTAGTESYTYDALGRVRTIAFPDGTKSTYDYDAAGNRLTVATGADVTAPSVPTGLTATAVSATQINLNWVASTDTGGSGLKGYKIYRDGALVKTTTTTATTYTDPGLIGSTQYSYKVAAYDNAGNVSGQSSAASATTLPGNYSDVGTLTQGIYHSPSGPNWTFFKGYKTSPNPVIGSYAPTALTGGKSVSSLYDFAVCSSQSQPPNCPYPGITTLTQYGKIIITGFTADPGAAWLISVTVGSVTRTGTTGTYAYSGGAATWTWSGATGSFGLSGSGSGPVTVTHK